MPYIETEGRYQVTITDIKFNDELGWDDPNAYKLTFYGQTPDGLEARADLIFSNKQLWNDRLKKNETSAEKSQRILEECGLPGGNIAELPKILTKEVDFDCIFVGKLKEGTDQKQYLNFYINPPNKGKSIQEADFSALAQRFAAMTGKPAPEQKPSAPPPFPIDPVNQAEQAAESVQPPADPMGEEDADCPF